MPIYTLTLKAKKTVADNTIEFQFEKPEGFTYVAGQYGGFTLIDPSTTDERGNTRRFSLISSPDEATLNLTTRMQSSAFKKNLAEMAIDSSIKFAGPAGNFILHEDKTLPAIMLAGGIGIAPFYSMIKAALKQDAERRITLFYGNQRLADTAYLSELRHLAHQHPSFTLVLVLANPDAHWEGEKGYITDELIIKHAPHYENAMFYACGSPAMVSAMQTLFTELNLSPERCRVEDFPGY